MIAWSPSITFFVPGIPAPGGSKVGYVSKYASRRTGKHFVVVKEDCARTKDWRASVALAASGFVRGDLLRGPLRATFAFTMPRPASHFGRRGLLPSAPPFPVTKPDTTKLVRSTEDALKGIVWADDSQIVAQAASKVYGENPGCQITVMVPA